MLVTPWGELTIRTLRGCRLGSEDGIAGRGVSGSEVSEESRRKSSVIGIYLLFWLMQQFTIRNIIIIPGCSQSGIFTWS